MTRPVSAPPGNAAHSNRADWLLLAPALAALPFLLAVLMTYPFGSDQAIFAVAADELARGRTLYAQAWDVKPPGIILLYLAIRGVLGTDPAGLRLVEFICLGMFPIIFARMAGWAGYGWKAGIGGAFIAVLCHVRLGFWHTGNAETFAGFAALGSVFATAAALARPRAVVVMALSGVLAALAALIKPPYGITLLPSLLWLARKRAAQGNTRVLAIEAAAAITGAGLPLAACAAWLVGTGAWEDFVTTMTVYAPALVTYDPLGPAVIANWFPAAGRILGNFSPYLLPGLALLVGLGRGRGRADGGVTGFVGTSAVLLVFAIGAQGKYYPYHFALVFPLLGFLAGLGLWAAWQRWALTGARALLLSALFFGSATLAPDGQPFWRPALARVAGNPGADDPWPTPRSDLRRSSAWLRSHTSAGDTLFVWGFDPLLYLGSGMRPASRFITNFPQRVAQLRAAAEAPLLDDLDASRPRAVVVVAGDAMPWMVHNDEDSSAALHHLHGLRGLLESHYRPAATLGRHAIYLRRTP